MQSTTRKTQEAGKILLKCATYEKKLQKIDPAIASQLPLYPISTVNFFRLSFIQITYDSSFIMRNRLHERKTRCDEI